MNLADYEDRLYKALKIHENFDLAEAKRLYLELYHEFANDELAYLLSKVFLQESNHAEALHWIKIALQKSDLNSDYQKQKALIYWARGDFELAHEIYLQILEQNSEDLESIYYHIKYLKLKKESEEAHFYIEQALKKFPEEKLLLLENADSYYCEENWDQALNIYADLLKEAPYPEEAILRLGTILFHQGQYQKALQYYQRMVDVFENSSKFFHNLATYLQILGHFSEAAEYYKKARLLEGPNASTLSQEGSVLFFCGQVEAGADLLKQALELDPSSEVIRDNYLYFLHHQSSLNPLWIAGEHKRLSGVEKVEFPRRTRQSNKVRVAWLSGDFRDHSVTFFLRPLLKKMDKNRFELIALSNVRSIDKITEELKTYFDQWHDVSHLSDQKAYDLMLHAQCDCAIDLSGHSEGNRLALFEKRIAPIQITYLGYPNGTGISNMDYRLSDSYAEPAHAKELYKETLVLLDHCFICFDKERELPALGKVREGNLVFASFNALTKHNTKLLLIYLSLLNELPGAKIMFKNQSLKDPTLLDHFSKRLLDLGFNKKQFELKGWIDDRDGHLALYRQVDFALDTFPYNGTTTTCEALLMGVPVLSFCGQSHASRVTHSILKNSNLDVFCAPSEDDFSEHVLKIAGDLEYWRGKKQEIRDSFLSSKVCDAENFAEEFSKTLEGLLK